MIKLSKLFIGIVTLPLPILFVTSCGNSLTNNTSYQKEITNKLNSALLDNANNYISPKTNLTTEINNFISFTSWTSLDYLIGEEMLGKYFTINETFKNLLSENDNEIFKNIKKVTIQPQENSRNLTIIFYLFNPSTDANIVSKEITNALSSNFSYKNKINIGKNPNLTKYNDTDAFNVDWNKISNPETCQETDLKNFLDNIFISTTTDWVTKIYEGYKSKNISIKNNNYKITIQFLPDAINKGYIFEFTGITQNNVKDIFFTSDSLI